MKRKEAPLSSLLLFLVSAAQTRSPSGRPRAARASERTQILSVPWNSEAGTRFSANKLQGSGLGFSSRSASLQMGPCVPRGFGGHEGRLCTRGHWGRCPEKVGFLLGCGEMVPVLPFEGQTRAPGPAAVAASRAQRRGSLCFRQGGWRRRALGGEWAEPRHEDKGTFVGIGQRRQRPSPAAQRPCTGLEETPESPARELPEEGRPSFRQVPAPQHKT